MSPEEYQWMLYIDNEVERVCEAKDWAHQVRRKWSVREKPVAESPVDDYEWKLIPGSSGKLPDAEPCDFDQGAYYVVGFNAEEGKFVVQHDTHRVGCMAPHWQRATYTEIGVNGAAQGARSRPARRPGIVEKWMIRKDDPPELQPPPAGWLRDHLLDIVSRFGPNTFSVT